jgi:cell division protease FtsH
MGALGYVMQVPEEEKYLNTKDELHAMLVGYLGGRAAEEIVFGTVTTGASNDIEKATKLARAMVTQYGMTEKFGLMGLATQESMYLNTGRMVMNCGDDTATQVDLEVMRILKECYEEAKEILNKNRFSLDRIAEYLIERETITGKEFIHILHDVQKEEDMKLHPEKYAGENADSEASVEKDSTDRVSKIENSDTNVPSYVPESSSQDNKGKMPFEEVRAMYAAQEVTEQLDKASAVQDETSEKDNSSEE